MATSKAFSYSSGEVRTSEKLTVSNGCSTLVFTKKADNSVILEYVPINHLTSNSGMGGDGVPIFKNLQSSEWIKIMAAYEKAKSRGRPGHIGPKGTTVFQYQSETISDGFIFDLHVSNTDLIRFFYSYI
ncbi:unnamed protein product [Rotaria socialis]|uniref:Uncharacterized protein n=1 Tax=Rotaria socialis TaxID=392032 RepID=A0A820GGT1_9BILA|nr:unnamed protein product [Rotaria socialis]CAF3458566.1 unnamed protein product [Rotaria socialis]CAF3462715.1 unnamed protein product [Rotaria socialis]CAF3624007.1 unnamed protein product [Rotaria socialis]CAF4170070.1 unnamed protein product [Rotaria socialis]